MKSEEVKQLFDRYVVPSYGRFDLVLERGEGSYVWDANGNRYLDLGAGIAVCSLGHAHPEIAQTLAQQAQRLIHVSNLYYHEWQGRLAQEIVQRIAPGRCFFANSGGEANEGLYKLARKFGHDTGRYEVITALKSFHGRTLGGIAATGQEKVKIGFEPIMEGFKYVPYNDLESVKTAITDKTVAILIEGIQGEGGITPAKTEYLLGLRKLCNEHKLLLMMDEVQCGYYRSGSYCSFQQILKDVKGGNEFLPDAVSMAKSIATGFPMSCFWVREPYSKLLGPGTHATTFGGTPLACSVALKVLEIIKRDKLAENVQRIGAKLATVIHGFAQKYPKVIEDVRGMGFMLGIVLNTSNEGAFAKREGTPAARFIQALRKYGVLAIPAGTDIVRLLPPLNLTEAQANEGLEAIERVAQEL